MKIDLQILIVRYHIYISMKSTASNTDQSILTTNISRTCSLRYNLGTCSLRNGFSNQQEKTLKFKHSITIIHI